MEVCEEALKLMKGCKRQPIRGLLHISGDGLRVVDSSTQGLILDQTIEKVRMPKNFVRMRTLICSVVDPDTTHII